MKLKNGDVMVDNFIEALKKLLQASMPVRSTFKLSQSLKIISVQYDEAMSARTTLIKKYGKDMGEGNFDVRQAPKEDQVKFFDELNELMSIEFEIPLEAKIELWKVSFPETVLMSPNEMFSLQSIADLEETKVEEKASDADAAQV